MRIDTLFSNEYMKIDYFSEENNQNLAYVFTPSMNRNLEGNAFGGEVFFRNGFDTIAFKISNDDWFQSIPEYLFNRIKDIYTGKKYRKKVSYGSSMGGFASIAFSKYLDCSSCVVFSPQFSINESYDTRWKKFSENIHFKYLINDQTINNKSEYIIFYDNKDPDSLHVDRLKIVLPYGSTKYIKLPYVGHPAAHYFSELGIIKNVLIDSVNNRDLESAKLLLNRHKSKSYLYNLSVHLYNKKHFNWSLSIINSALILDSNKADFHKQKCLILQMMQKNNESIDSILFAEEIDPTNIGYLHIHANILLNLNLLDEAIVVIEKAILLSPNNPHLRAQYSVLFYRKGQFNEALTEINLAISIDPNFANFHKHKSSILEKMGQYVDAVASIKEALDFDPVNLIFQQQLSEISNKS